MRNHNLAFLLLLIGASGVLPYAVARESHQPEESQLFWPPPPAESRIFFVKNCTGYRDMEVKKSFFSRLKDVFRGREEYFFSRPAAVAIGKDGTVYIADAGAGAVYSYQPKKKRLRRIIQVDKKINLVSPVGIGVSADGILVIADSCLKKVFAINEKGKSRFILDEKDGLARPTGVCVSGKRLYVVDTQSCQVAVFDLKGRKLFTFGKKGKGQGEFNLPTHICVDDSGKMYVSDTLNGRIQVFDSNGNFLKTIGSMGDGSGNFSRPKGIAVDVGGHIYVADALFDNIQIFNYEKHFLLSFGTAGEAAGEFWMPAGIAIDKDNYIYVADSYNRRISIFQYRRGK